MLFRLSTSALALVPSVLIAGSTLGAAARDHRAALAMFLLGQHVGFLDRGVVPLRLAAGVVTMLLSVTFDLDRTTAGSSRSRMLTGRVTCLDELSAPGQPRVTR